MISEAKGGQPFQHNEVWSEVLQLSQRLRPDPLSRNSRGKYSNKPWLGLNLACSKLYSTFNKRLVIFLDWSLKLGFRKSWPLGSRLWGLTASLLLSHCNPGSGVVQYNNNTKFIYIVGDTNKFCIVIVVLDCVDSWSLHPFLLYLSPVLTVPV